jgi:predicted GNAT family acetyltransferase
MTNSAALTVQHNPQAGHFEIVKDGLHSVLEYRLVEGVIIFTHTGVPELLGGQGIGSQLARSGLDYARSQGYKVISHCWFISAYIRKNPEYLDLLK